MTYLEAYNKFYAAQLGSIIGALNDKENIAHFRMMKYDGMAKIPKFQNQDVSGLPENCPKCNNPHDVGNPCNT